MNWKELLFGKKEDEGQWLHSDEEYDEQEEHLEAESIMESLRSIEASMADTVKISNKALRSATLLADKVADLEARSHRIFELEEKCHSLSEAINNITRNENSQPPASVAAVREMTKNLHTLPKEVADMMEDISNLRRDVSRVELTIVDSATATKLSGEVSRLWMNVRGLDAEREKVAKKMANKIAYLRKVSSGANSRALATEKNLHRFLSVADNWFGTAYSMAEVK